MTSLRGVEALRLLPFTEVATEEDTAKTLLRGRLISIISDVVDQFVLVPEARSNTKKNLMLLVNGGRSIPERLIEELYADPRKPGFYQVAQFIMGEITSRLEIPLLRNAHVFRFGMVLDLLDLINPRVASFEEGVQTMTEAMRIYGDPNFPFQFGKGVTLTRLAISSKPGLFDPLADRAGADKFDQSFMKVASSGETALYTKGLNTKPPPFNP